MPDLGKKYTCYSCHTKFYDLGKAEPICPKCGADQRDAEEAPATTSHRGRAATRVVEPEPAEEEFPAEGEAAPTAGGEADEEEEMVTPEREEEQERKTRRKKDI